MKTYEYRIEKHSLAEFAELIFFCTEKGECSLDKVPNHQIEHLTDHLNSKGAEGFELVQLIFGKDGIMTIWKKGAVSGS